MKNFGETVEGYNVPVLNEREVRAAAGILFLMLFLSLMLIIFNENFILIKYMIVTFLTDFIIRVFISPKYAPSLVIGRLIVSGQTPEYVSAAPKKFAWVIGLVLASIMFILMVLVNSYSIITGLICLTCLIFLFFESVFGICLGCLFYPMFYKNQPQLCPGDICEVKTKHKIQKVNVVQIGTILGLAGLIVVTSYFFNDYMSITPRDLWEILK